MTGNKVLLRTRWLVACFFSLSVFLSPVSLSAQLMDVVDTNETTDVFLYKGDLVTLVVHSLTRLSLGANGIVDIVNADVNELLIIGQTVGAVPLYIWDEYGKRTVNIRVLPADMDRTIARTQTLVEAAGIKGVNFQKNYYDGKVVATGNVPQSDTEQLDTIINEGEGRIINFVKEAGDLIQLDVQVSELSETLSSVLGFDWSTGEVEGIVLPYQETLPTTDGSFSDYFKIGDFNRTAAITATVNALITEGKARVLSKPTILVKDGEEASFLVGGEIPVRSTTTSASGNSVTENITYTEYGVDVTATPEIINGKIEVTLRVNIRDIDAANAVEDNVAFTTREATTILRLNDGQTVVLAGLIKHNKATTIKRVPFLSAIPLVGLLFREKTVSPNQEQEVVISLTPRILRQGEMEKRYEKNQELMTQDQEEDAFLEASEQEQEDPLALARDALMEDDMDTAQDVDAEMAYAMPAQDSDAVEAVMDPVSFDEPAVMDEAASDAITKYAQEVQRRISQGISYPYDAKQKGLTGTVTLSLTILSDGTLSDASVKESSGQNVFDKDALNTAQILAPFDPFPADIDMAEIVVTIPIVYSPDSALGAESGA